MNDKYRDRPSVVLPTPPYKMTNDGQFDKAFPAPDLDARKSEKAEWEQHQADFESLISEQLIPFMEKHNLVTGTIVSGLGTKAVAKKNKHGFFTVTITKKQYNV